MTSGTEPSLVPGEAVPAARAPFRGTALIVDDDGPFAEQLRKTLNGMGLRVESAGTLDVGLAHLSFSTSKRGRYDWLLFDLLLGRQTCEPLVDAAVCLNPRPGLVAMTSFVDAACIQAVSDRAFVLMKPFVPEQLIKVLQATGRPQALAACGPAGPWPQLPTISPHALEADQDLPLIRRGPQYVRRVCGRGRIVAFGAAAPPAWLLRYWGSAEPDGRCWHAAAVAPGELDFSDVALILVDESLEGETALAYCEMLREAGVDAPLLVTGTSSGLDGTALAAGADSFAKTGSWRVGMHANTLLRYFARVHGVRRGVELDYARKDVVVHGRHIHLTSREFAIVAVLASAGARVVPLSEITAKVFNAHVSDRATRSAIARIRVKFGSAAHLIVNVKGKGYRLGD